jgi:hypothetical protein
MQPLLSRLPNEGAPYVYLWFLLRVARARAQTGGHQGGGGPLENEEGANSNNSDSEQHLDNLRRKGLLPNVYL